MTSTHSTIPSSVSAHSSVPQDAGTNSDIKSEDEEPSQVGISLILRIVESVPAFCRERASYSSMDKSLSSMGTGALSPSWGSGRGGARGRRAR